MSERIPMLTPGQVVETAPPRRVMVRFRLYADDAAELLEECKRRGMTTAELARERYLQGRDR
jgi:hypothetical protein